MGCSSHANTTTSENITFFFFFFFKVQAQRNSLLVQETSRYQSISSFSGWIEDDIKSILCVVLSYSN